MRDKEENALQVSQWSWQQTRNQIKSIIPNELFTTENLKLYAVLQLFAKQINRRFYLLRIEYHRKITIQIACELCFN